MTKEAEGEYFSYCDQDDIWMPAKLAILQERITSEDAELICSDMYIIDKNGKKIADSITKIRKHHVFRSGYGLTDTLWYSNFSSGCSMLMKTVTAKKAIPFNPYMFSDHYLAFYAADSGKVISLEAPLLYHREHGTNQSSLLQGITDRNSYYRIRVDQKLKAVSWLHKRFTKNINLSHELTDGKRWLTARMRYARGDKPQWKTIWRFRRYGKLSSILEIMMPYLPNMMFKGILWLGKHNYI